MKKENIFLAVILPVATVVTIAGIVLMTVCGLFAAGVAVMAVGLFLFVPVCPVYRKIGGYASLFRQRKKIIFYVTGIVLLIALGTGIALGCSPVDTIAGLQTGGFMLVGFSAALLVVNALMYDD